MSGEHEKRSARSAIILALVAVVVALYSSAYGMQTLQWVDAHRSAKAEPWLNSVPQTIASAPTAAAAPAAVPATTAKGARITLQANPGIIDSYGYEFSVPWTGKFKQVPLAIGAEYQFDSGQVVVFFDPEAQVDILQGLRTAQSSQGTALQNLVNDGSIATNYALFQAVYNASAVQLSPVMSYANAQRDRVLLLTKLAFGPDLDRPVYSFDFGNNKGFQFGDPAQGPVAVRVFNSRDHQFRFIFTRVPVSGATITQSDIDQALTSLETEPFETK